MPEILASFSRASGRSVNLPESKSTSDILTTRPRAVSRVSRIKLNCWRRRTKLFAVANGLLKLRIGGGCGGAIPVGSRFSGLLFLPCFIAVSFGVGLSTSGLMSGGLRIEVLAVRVVTLANGVGGNGFGVDSAL